MIKILQSTSAALLLLLTSSAFLGAQPAQAATTPAIDTPPADAVLISQAAPLRRGDTSDAVVTLQQQLTSLGYFSGAATGFFGEFTEAAVIRFQQDAGLTADGLVGAGTSAAIQQRLAPPATPSGTLRLDDRGEQVSELQRRLTELGYFSGPVSGTFGPLTQDAVVAFQRASGLTADGIVGPGTSDALRRATAPVPVNPPATTVLRRGDSGAQVVDLQSRLRQLGFYSGTLNGNFGSLTESAVIAFQQSRGLTADGIAGPQVRSELERLTSSSANPGSEQPLQPSEGGRRARLSDDERYSVAELQRRLQDQGHNPGNTDGVLTAETRQAIVAAQREHGLSQRDLPRP
jgi:peptidoglycan hydrolase-like protein with peptidoglycan-binding domain